MSSSERRTTSADRFVELLMSAASTGPRRRPRPRRFEGRKPNSSKSQTASTLSRRRTFGAANLSLCKSSGRRVRSELRWTPSVRWVTSFRVSFRWITSGRTSPNTTSASSRLEGGSSRRGGRCSSRSDRRAFASPLQVAVGCSTSAPSVVPSKLPRPHLGCSTSAPSVPRPHRGSACKVKSKIDS